MASLDQIVADVKQQREKSHDHQSATPEITLPYQPHPSTSTQHATHSVASTSQQWSDGHGDKAGVPMFSFDDDSDLDSPTGYDISQIAIQCNMHVIKSPLHY